MEQDRTEQGLSCEITASRVDVPESSSMREGETMRSIARSGRRGPPNQLARLRHYAGLGSLALCVSPGSGLVAWQSEYTSFGVL